MKYNPIRIAHELIYYVRYYNLCDMKITESNYRQFTFSYQTTMFFEEYSKKVKSYWTMVVINDMPRPYPIENFSKVINRMYEKEFPNDVKQ